MKAKTKAHPLISIIVPVYNVENFLDQCLESVTNQTYPNLEIILIDDGSTDNSGKICNKWQKQDKRIKTIHQKNAGLSAARNTGLQNAIGEYISFVDSDDWLELNCIETLYRILEDHHCEISMANRFLEYANKTVATSGQKISLLSSQDCLFKILYSNNIDVSACGKLYHKSLFQEIAFPNGKKFEDIATTYRPIMRASRIIHCSIPLYHYRKNNPNSITHASFSSSELDRVDLAIEATQDILKVYPSLNGACRRFMTYSYLGTLSRAGNANTKDLKVIKMLIHQIKQNRAFVIRDRNAPRKDKAALLCTYLGYRFYCFIWKTFYTRKETK